MIIRTIFLAAVLASVPAVKALCQDAPLGSTTELKAAVQDEQHFTILMTEIWVLRDILALQAGGDISADAKAFQALQDNLRSQRGSLADKLAAQQSEVQLPADVVTSASKLPGSLNSFGVQPTSELGKRLLLAYALFSQSLAATSLGSLCDVHPFRMHCQP
jgi:hypothetical protein